MFRHTGQRRTHKHNIRLAELLCLTAGFVNVAGFLAFAVLTTNVTGHAALFAEKFSAGDFRDARMVGLWMLLFLAGAFSSSLYIGWIGRKTRFRYGVPVILEILILLFVGSYAHIFDHSTVHTEIFAGSLLFAMGMQNALVSVISGSIVRTTHLTGMFTDLGIELASAVYSKGRYSQTVREKIILRVVIISFFLLGGILGGYAFVLLKYHTFYIPALVLLIALFYDAFRVNAAKVFHRVTRKENEGNNTVI